jgi:hypothetical protein
MRRSHLIRIPDVHLSRRIADVHVTPGRASGDRRRYSFDAVAAFVADRKARDLSPKTVASTSRSLAEAAPGPGDYGVLPVQLPRPVTRS